ncbi:hypothetical protein, conserved in T. vivax [Trypanosoma vivax Y486]|uniref:Uncharacterized protein n=1 Tax=Trypanosoma vivax (strain Y486) TaxID=1055687 RepID=F9WVV9_TRYVY|nr:hypothetical protein, conserved in T. vivax [Trypanosoma vivax Y486]|eukprot:CCD21721.1 hypothetical protein, conserved in T. vivax [Trypanosoma vivax Y486]
MSGLSQLFLVLWLCTAAALGTGETNCTVSSQKEDCEKEFLWILYVIIDTPFRRAEQLVSYVFGEVKRNEQKKREIDEAIKSLNDKLYSPKSDSSLRSQLSNQSAALEKSIKLYQNVLANIKSSVEKMKKTTADEDDAIGRLNVVSGSLWKLGESYGGWFEDLRKTFELIEKRRESSKYKTFANEYVENVVAAESNLTNVQAVLFKLLDNVTERYKDKVGGYVKTSLEYLQSQAQMVIRNFTIDVKQIQGKIEAEMMSVDGKKTREDVEAAEKKIVGHISQMVREVRAKRCDKCTKWRELRNKTRADENLNLLKLRLIVGDLELIEKTVPFFDLKRIKSKFGGLSKREGNDWEVVWQANESSKLMKAWEDNTSQLETQRQQQLQQLVEKSAKEEGVWLENFGDQIRCKELDVKDEQARVFADVHESVFASADMECHNLSPVSEKNISVLLKVLPFLENASESATIASGIEIENSMSKKLMNETSRLLDDAKNLLVTYKWNILNDANYVRNGTCAVQGGVAESYLKLDELKRQLRQAKEEISMLRSGPSTRTSFENKETSLVTPEKDVPKGFLVRQGERMQKLLKHPGRLMSDNASTLVSALLEQAEHVGGSKARGAGCAVWTGSETDLNVTQLVANLTGEINVHDVLLEVHASILRRVARGERLLTSLRDAKKKLEAEIEEARRGEQCEPVWRQLLRLVRG